MKKSGKFAGKILAAVVSMAIILTIFSACGSVSESGISSASVVAASDSAASAGNLNAITLKFFIPGDDRPAKAEVLNALYQQTKERLNAKFEINFIPFGDYQNKLTMMAASGDDYDVAFTADWFGFSNMVNKGAFLGITDLAKQYAPTLYKFYEDNGILGPCSIDGQLMALPWTEVKTSKPVFMWRKDIADKLGVQPSDLTTIEGIDQFVTAIASAKPGMTVFDMNVASGRQYGDIIALLQPKYEFMDMGFHSFVVDLNDTSNRVVPVEQTDMFREAVKLAKKWYDSGVISKNSLAEKEVKLFESGKIFSGKNISEKLYEKTNFTDKTAVCGAVEVYPDNKFNRDTPLNNAMAVNKNAANPERALMFFELISTDSSVYDTLIYGIKDKTYTIDDKGIVGFTKEEDPAKPLWQNWNFWGFLRHDFVKPTVTRDAEAIQKEYEYSTRPNILVSPISGFVANPDPIKTELARRDQILEEQGKLLLAGIVKGDIDKSINDYIAKQKAAGLDKIIAELQKQVDSKINR